MNIRPLCLLLGWLLCLPLKPYAQEGPMLGEVKMFAGTYAPQGWAFCEGQSLPISQYSALFSILGTQYGGNGRSTFNLPNLQGVPSASMGHEFAISRGGGGSVSFDVINKTDQAVEMYWIDFDGVPKLYGTLGPGESAKQLSGSRQVWHFKQGGRLVYTALLSDEARQTITIQKPVLVRYIICLEGIFPPRP